MILLWGLKVSILSSKSSARGRVHKVDFNTDCEFQCLPHLLGQLLGRVDSMEQSVCRAKLAHSNEPEGEQLLP